MAQVAIAQGAEVHVLTRSAPARELALDLGAASAGPPTPRRPNRSTPRSCSRRPASWCRWRCGRWTRAARSPWPASTSPTSPAGLPRQLFREKQLRSVTANTRADGDEFLRLAAALRIRPTVDPRPLDEADHALADLAADRITGAAVLVA